MHVSLVPNAAPLRPGRQAVAGGRVTRVAQVARPGSERRTGGVSSADRGRSCAGCDGMTNASTNWNAASPGPR